MFNKPRLEFYFDNRNGQQDITPVSRLYRVGVVNTTNKSIDEVSVTIASIHKNDGEDVRGDLWGLQLLMMHDRSVPLRKTFTLHPQCEQALDFVQSVPSIKAEYKAGRHEQLNIGRKIVVWHAARRYWRGGGGAIQEDYSIDPLIESCEEDDVFTFHLVAAIGPDIENRLAVRVWFDKKVLKIHSEHVSENLPKRIREYATSRG